MALDLLRPGLKLVFCGYNPSLTSGRSGHHYAHPGNRFWRVLYASGITGRLYRPEEDEQLPDAFGIGFTKTNTRHDNAPDLPSCAYLRWRNFSARGSGLGEYSYTSRGG